MEVEQVAKKQFWNLDPSSIEDIASEARCLQWQRYGNLLDDQAACHIRCLVMQAARDLGYLPKSANVGGQGSERVEIVFSSLEQLREDTGYEPAVDAEPEKPERPEAAIARILPYLPEGPMQQVFLALLDEEASSVEQAAKAANLVPQRVFDALEKIGTLFQSYDCVEDGLLFTAVKSSDKGLKSAIARICDSLAQRDPTKATLCWEQGGLFV